MPTAHCVAAGLAAQVAVAAARAHAGCPIEAGARSAAAPGLSPCKLNVPADLSVARNRPRPTGLVPWSAANISALVSAGDWDPHSATAKRMRIFSPTSRSVDGWEAVIRASQNPPSCERFLLLEDDQMGSGLGMDVKMMTVVLLAAVTDNRVLLHVPGSKVIYRHMPNVSSGRWCDRPPYTYDCMWEPLSYCDPPPPGAREVLPSHPRNPRPYWDSREPIVRVPLNWAYRTQAWRKFQSTASLAASRYLFRPRPWVADLASCVMECGALRPRQFVSVFLRGQSAEKVAEMAKSGALPTSASYAALASTAVRELGLSKTVFVQSPSQAAIDEFRGAAPELALVYTDNPRSELDSWGGRFQHLAMSSGSVAAVNLHISSQAALYIGLSGSMWTMLAGKMIIPSAAAKLEWVGVACNLTRESPRQAPMRPVVGTSLIPADSSLAMGSLQGALDTTNRQGRLFYSGPPPRKACRIRTAVRSCVTCG